MTRNLARRVEAVAPVEDPEAREDLDFVLETMLSDNRRRWRMNADWTYHRRRPDENGTVVDTHRRLMRRAEESVFEESLTERRRSGGRQTAGRDPSVDLDDTFTGGQPDPRSIRPIRPEPTG
jgi:polyphosphate kinase